MFFSIGLQSVVHLCELLFSCSKAKRASKVSASEFELCKVFTKHRHQPSLSGWTADIKAQSMTYRSTTSHHPPGFGAGMPAVRMPLVPLTNTTHESEVTSSKPRTHAIKTWQRRWLCRLPMFPTVRVHGQALEEQA